MNISLIKVSFVILKSNDAPKDDEVMINIPNIERITIDPNVMGGKPCIRGIRITVGTITGLLASGESIASVLSMYPSLEKEDIYAALTYATWRSEEYDIPLIAS